MESPSKKIFAFKKLDLLSAAVGLCWGITCTGYFFDLFIYPAIAKLGLLQAFSLPLAFLAVFIGRRWVWPEAAVQQNRRKLLLIGAASLLVSGILILLAGLKLQAPPSLVNIILTMILYLTGWIGLSGLLFFAAAKFPVIAIIFCWPFLFLFPYVFSIAGRFVAIGNDFTPFYYVYKIYLLDSLSHNHFPLWSPSESAGYPFFSSPLAEAFYPLNWPLSVLYRLNGGYTLQDHQVFTVLGIAIFSVGMYLWLRQLRLNQRAVLAGVLVMAVSFKVTEIIRFPNAIHTAAWYPWILLALTKILLAKNWKERVGYSLLLVFSGISLVTGGYPYFTYYTVFLAVPYLLVFLIPPLRRELIGEQKVEWKKSLLPLGASAVAAATICLPWLYHVTQLMQETSKRAGNNLEHALSYGFSWQDTAASIFFPPAAMPEGWFFFGSLAEFLVIVFLIIQPFRSEGASRKQGWVRIFFAVWFVVISLLSYGEQSFIFKLFYAILPFFTQLRAWSRLNIVLVPIFAWLVAIAWQSFEDWLKNPPSLSMQKGIRYTLIGGLITLVIQLVYLASGTAHLYWDIFFIPRMSYLLTSFFAQFGKDVIYSDAVLSFVFRLAFIVAGALACLLTVLVLKNRSKIVSGRVPSYLNAILIGFVLFSAANQWFAGPWLWTNGVVPMGARQELNVERQNLMSFGNPRKDQMTTLTLSQSFSAGSDARWHFDRYKDFRAKAAVDPAAEAKLLGITDGQKLYFTPEMSPVSIQSFLDEANRFEGAMKVVDYNGDVLILSVDTPADGFVHFIDNWDEGWIARLDGQPVEIYQLFDVFKSVRVPTGQHLVEMIYCPTLFSVLNPACR
jgi:hypothetical protein